MAEITTVLTRALFGIGNAQHDHVHRHNTLQLENQEIDKLRFEQDNGGVLPRTLHDIAMNCGQLNAQPGPYVSVEEGMNLRRGFCMLKFKVYSNAAEESDMSVLCIVVGGTCNNEGISGDTRLVPIRCFSTLTTNVSDGQGYPFAKTVIDSTHQFMQGDPYEKQHLAAVRPYDVASASLGYAVTEGEGRAQNFCGTANSDLDAQVLMSKTQNLNPVSYSKELLRMAVVTADGSRDGRDLAYSIGDYMTTSTLNEISPHDNPFMQTMMSVLGIHSTAGFRGWSVEEMVTVWENFLDVLNLDNMDVTKFHPDNNKMTTMEYGRVNQFEIIAGEAAMMTAHLLVARGLMSYQFSATNNPASYEGIQGAEEGIMISPGKSMSVLDNDLYAENKVETFNRDFTDSFFAKYSGPYAHLRTLINLTIEAHLFGETKVTISFGDNPSEARTFSNATYYLSFSSSNIAGSETGLLESKNYVKNLKEYF